MELLTMILLTLALFAFIGAAFRVGTTKTNLMAVGLGFWVLVPWIETLRNLN